MSAIRIPHLLRRATDGKAVVHVDGFTLEEVLHNLCRSQSDLRQHLFYPTGALKPHVLFAVDGEQARMNTVVQPGSTVELIVMAAGGRT